MIFTIIHKKRSAVLFTASDEIFVLVANEPNVYRGVWFRHVFRFRTFKPGHLTGTISSRRLRDIYLWVTLVGIVCGTRRSGVGEVSSVPMIDVDDVRIRWTGRERLFQR